MRKYFLSIVALVGMIFATSCQESLVEPQIDGTTAFTVQVPNQMGTKAIGEASSVTQLLVDVYPFGVEEPIYQTLGTPTSEGFEVELNLIQDQKYDILFWAQTANGYVNVYGNETDGYSFGSLRNVPMNSIYLNNDNGAAFFHAEKGFVPSGTSTTITLVRPFAQLNLGTTDLSLKPATGDVKLHKSLITVKGVATNFNVYEGLGFGNKDVVYVYGPEVQGQDKQPVAVPTDPKTFTIGEGTATQTFNYVSMNYLAVLGDTKAVVDVDAKIIVKDPAINGEERIIEHSFKSVPVQENYRTNIVGNLISSTTDFIVEVNDNWAGDYTEEYVAPGIRLVNDVYEITSEEGLWSFAELVNGGTKAGGKSFLGETIKLTCDIDLESQPWTPISLSTDLANDETFRGTFDGNGHTIEGLYVNRNDVAGLFGYVYAATIKNVTVKGASINSNHYAGGIVGWALNNTGNIKVPMIIENCHVKNSIIASTPELVNGEWDNGDKVGGIIGYAAYIGGTGGDINDGAGIFRCSVESTTIKAYRDFGGIAGYAKSVKIEQLKVQNVTLELDLSQDYQSTTPTTYGQIIGRDEGGNIVDGVSLAVTVTTSEELEQVVKSATTDITVKLGANITGNVTVIQKPGVKITIDGNQMNYQGFIKVHSNSNHYADAALTIKNVNFETSTVYYDSDNEPYFNFIEALENGSERYSTNITVDSCTFTATGDAVNEAVALQIKASKNAKALNCTATDLHSLVQAQSCDETVVVKGCTIKGKNGVAFKQVKDAKVEGTTITATGYGIRFDGNIDNYGITVQDNNVTAVQPLIVRKMTGQNNTITLNGENTLTPATEGDYQIVITNGSDDAEYVKPTGTYTLTGADEYKVYPPTPVAKVGNTEYTTIDEAITNWTNGSTLTLLANVTLSDVVTLKSTEHHILNLGTYTMTAASGKDAIEITCNGRSNASYALTINADATNPGGITATGKSCIYYKKSDSTKDRPIILINNGVFTGSYSINSTSNGNTNCPQVWINGGVFNSYMNLTKNMLKISGGTFHAAINCTGDSSAYREIKGGRFKSWQFMTADAPNKFWVGSGNGNYNVGCYVDDEGYLVVGGPVITEFGDKFAAKATGEWANWKQYDSFYSYLKYSSVAEYDLYYTNAELAIKKHGAAKVVLK